MNCEKALERLDFEKKWLVKLLNEDNLVEVDLDYTFNTIREIIEGLGKENE